MIRLGVLIFFLVSCGLYGQTRIDSLYQIIGTAQDDSLRVVAYQDISALHYRRGEIDSSIALVWKGLQLIDKYPEDARYQPLKGKLYAGMAICYYRQGDMDITSAYLDSSYHNYSLFSDTAHMIAVVGIRGWVAEFRGDIDSAISCYKKVIEYKKTQADTAGQLAYWYNLAGVYKRQQLYDEAAEMYKQGLVLAKKSKNISGLGKGYKGLGDIANYRGLYNMALDNYAKSITYYEQANNLNALLNVKGNQALVYSELGEYESAMRIHRETLAANRQMGKEKGILEDYQVLGEIHFALNNLDSARWYYEASLEIAQRIDYPRGEANAMGQLAKLYLNLGFVDKSENAATQATVLFAEMKNEYRQWKTALILAEALFKKRQLLRSEELAKTCYEKGQELQILTLSRDAVALQYKLYKYRKQYQNALGKLEELQVLSDSLQNEELRKSAIRSDLEYAYQKASLADSLQAAQEKHNLNMAYTEKLQEQKRREMWITASVVFVLILALGLFSRVRYVQRARKRIQAEKDRSDELLLNILPTEVAEELKMYGKSEARDFERVTVLFTDFQQFTETAAKLNAKELVGEINTCFRAFDEIIEKHGIEKIKTIGDAYMAAGGLHVPRTSEPKDVVCAALEMQAFMLNHKAERAAAGLVAFNMRVGIHTGPVVAGIVGVKKFQYDIWGDTVNTASRMESSGAVGKVNISNDTYQLIKNNPQFSFDSRGKVAVKGKGEMEMWFVALKE